MYKVKLSAGSRTDTEVKGSMIVYINSFISMLVYSPVNIVQKASI